MTKRRELLPKLKWAKEESKIAYFSYDKLIIKGRPTSANYSSNLYERITKLVTLPLPTTSVHVEFVPDLWTGMIRLYIKISALTGFTTNVMDYP